VWEWSGSRRGSWSESVGVGVGVRPQEFLDWLSPGGRRNFWRGCMYRFLHLEVAETPGGPRGPQEAPECPRSP